MIFLSFLRQMLGYYYILLNSSFNTKYSNPVTCECRLYILGVASILVKYAVPVPYKDVLYVLIAFVIK
jgi:hypothetical protein